ncbi:probable lipase at C-terminar half [Coccomyxa sp. Obi]|nr:probable lipase at C-terminar half [Coccomyxa sp. Obi]
MEGTQKHVQTPEQPLPGAILPQRDSNIPLRQRYAVEAAERERQAARLQSTGTSSASTHAEPGPSAVATRLQYMSAADMKWTMSFLRIAEVIAAALLALILVAKLKDRDHWLATRGHLSIAGTVIFSFMFLLLLAFFAAFAARVHHSVRQHCEWTQRQRRALSILAVEALTQILNLGFVVAADIYLLLRPCHIRSRITTGLTFGNWTCWNTLFLILTVRAHNLNMWQDRHGNPKGGCTDATLLDAPWSIHVPKLGLWTTVEVLNVVQTALAVHGTVDEAPSDCSKWKSDCRQDVAFTTLAGVIFAIFFAYFGLFFYYLSRAFRQLRAHNYRDFRVTNQTARLMLRTRVTAITIFAAAFVIYYFVKMDACPEYTSSASGYLPLHLVMTAKVAVQLYLYTPTDPALGQQHVLQAWLQQFSWTEADKPGKLEQRRRQARESSAAREALDREPMFCFETAIKLYYFSHIIYYYEKLEGVLPECAACARNPVEHVGLNRQRLSQTLEQLRPRMSNLDQAAGRVPSATAPSPAAFATHLSGVQGVGKRVVCPECQSEGRQAPITGVGSGGSAAAAKLDSLDFALGLYRLEDLEMMWERLWDTVALVGWGPGRIVVVFRGTTTLKNVFADLQAWQATHPSARGRSFLGRRPAVHNGFLKSYLANGFNERIVSKVLDVVRSNDWPSTQVYLTGHSLGGALAMLAAYDVARALEGVAKRTEVACYTFGSPRVGNYAFAWDYGKTVPDSWSIVNDQDAVARNAKFWLLYKRPGQRVLINDRGDMLVRPSFVELSMQQSPFLTSLSQHYLLSYRDSLAAVCTAQMSRKKRVQGGLAGVMVLLEGDEFVRGILEPAGLTLADVRNRHLISSKSPLQEQRPWTASRQLSRPRALPIGPTSTTTAERPTSLPSPFHEVALLPGLKLAQQPSTDAAAAAAQLPGTRPGAEAAAAAQLPGTRPAAGAAAAAERPGVRDEERADAPRPMQPRHSARVANDFWWTALPRGVSSRSLGPQMNASLAGLPPRPDPPKPAALSPAYSGVRWFQGAKSGRSSSGPSSLGATASMLAGLGDLFRGHAPPNFLNAAAAPSERGIPGAQAAAASRPPNAPNPAAPIVRDVEAGGHEPGKLRQGTLNLEYPGDSLRGVSSGQPNGHA